MENLTALLDKLPGRHKDALLWFNRLAGTIQAWPAAMQDRTLLASKAKGIYKPSWTDYALSIRQSSEGPYPDRQPVVHSDGTWTFLYFQEGNDPDARDRYYTNRGMLACKRDKVPVGVIKQIETGPSRYLILGLALVVGWEGGYFFMEGFSAHGEAFGSGPRALNDAFTLDRSGSESVNGAFDPENMADAREKVAMSIVLRQGQMEFRQNLMEAYAHRCAVSGCEVEEVLEASHIMPYLGPQTNHISNGILLRADIHTLFDLGLLAIDADTITLLVSERLNGSSYEQLRGKCLDFPSAPESRPSSKALALQREWAGL